MFQGLKTNILICDKHIIADILEACAITAWQAESVSKQNLILYKESSAQKHLYTKFKVCV